MNKKSDKESMICLTPKPSQSFFVYRLQSKKNFLVKKSFLRKRGSRGLNKKQKECFLTAFVTAIKKDPTTSIKKQANELKDHEKTVRIAIKQDLSPDLNPLNYAHSHPNIGSLKTAIEEEWNKMSEEFILKACKSFRERVDTIIETMVAILSKFTVLYLAS